jgi:phospholipid-translocating ATPase
MLPQAGDSMEEEEDVVDSMAVPPKQEGCWQGFKSKVSNFFTPPKVYHQRTIELDMGRVHIDTNEKKLPENIIKNTKYNVFTFLPVVLFEQFKFFFNLYFLVVAISQFIPALQVGYLFTYVAPLVFVLAITMAKEAYDDFQRYKRDKEANSQLYSRLAVGGITETVPSSELRIGDLIQVHTDQRVPADIILLRTTEKAGASFIRTDQLDGETDWKLRKAVATTQKFPSDDSLTSFRASVFIEKPRKEIYQFVGNFNRQVDAGGNKTLTEPLSIENTIWANSVIASGTIIGLVIYAGTETRAVMNTSHPSTKMGKLDSELNFLAKWLCALLVLLAIILESLNRFKGSWFISLFRFVLLFSSIIPISLRVNLDMGKIIYSLFIMRDESIEGTVVRNSTIPEELGRISYLMSDKTGTLTQNEMVFKKLHLGSIVFGQETLDEIVDLLAKSEYSSGRSHSMEPASSSGFDAFGDFSGASANNSVFSDSQVQRSMPQKVRQAIMSLALAHNVTPTTDELGNITYQASSPDEVALVKFTESVGMTLVARDMTSMTIKSPSGRLEEFEILNVFPFTSETKRMGIIVRDKVKNKIEFYMKGADVAMSRIVEASDWLEEECGNMAREGLRTLVFGMRTLEDHEYEDWLERYNEAKTSIHDREANVQATIEKLEVGLKLLGLTGVEDKLQVDVKPTLESLRNAGIRIWMLTGDKIETATCIAISARLVARSQPIFQLVAKSPSDAYQLLNSFGYKKDTALVIDGNSLQMCLDHHKDTFISVAVKAPAVVCCRCSPTQKAEIVTLVKNYTKLRTCAIGDGGNDVSMIQAADVGLGIVGKEGKQASLAADFSINQFSYIAPLLLWHGRNSYKRSARLSQFIIHRGLVISFIQAIFSAIFYFAAIPIYQGWLVVGYSTVFTMAPVFSLVLDEDVSRDIAFQFPELYQDLQKGRSLNLKTFVMWVFISIYQGGMIMLLSVLLFDASLYSIVSITYTTLIFAQLLNVAFEIRRWHWAMIVSEIVSLVIYIASLFILRTYFDITFILTGNFVWKTLTITAITTLPIYLFRFIKRRCDPPAYSKLG